MTQGKFGAASRAILCQYFRCAKKMLSLSRAFDGDGVLPQVAIGKTSAIHRTSTK